MTGTPMPVTLFVTPAATSASTAPSRRMSRGRAIASGVDGLPLCRGRGATPQPSFRPARRRPRARSRPVRGRRGLSAGGRAAPGCGTGPPSLAMHSAWAAAATRRCRSPSTRIASLVRRTAPGAASPSSSSSTSRVWSSPSAVVSRWTMPSRCASTPSIRRPVSTRSVATLRPTSSASRVSPPARRCGIETQRGGGVLAGPARGLPAGTSPVRSP